MAERSPAKNSQRLRCAVYTRKSSEEGLGQEFNSLEAQREACEAYIASQRQEGWVLIREPYDDGGFSGGTMERPALKRLLADIAGGKVDVVVVYKVDRLTRALSDFARIIEQFDRHSVSFVSVTQAFNTTTSMGRLTLNVLLSFAQFEREVTGERIRDKIAASKKKGMWMGGQPALGYDVRDRRLVVNAAEAETVRHIFRRYAELKSVRQLRQDLDAAGIVSKGRIAADGSPYGGQPLGRGALYAMLQNRIYRGEISHKGAAYPGQHDAIVDAGLFDQVQATLDQNRNDRMSDHDPSPLTGLLIDADGERLTPSAAMKRDVRYRYYISRHLVTGSKSGARGLRLPAGGIEALVRTRIGALLADPGELASVIGSQADQAAVIVAAAAGLSRWTSLNASEFATALNGFVTRVTVQTDHVELTLSPGRLVAWVLERPAQGLAHGADTVITAPVAFRKRGQELRLVLGSQDEPPPGHAALVRLLTRAHHICKGMFEDGLTIDEIARSEGLIPSYVTRLVRLAFLAPDIVASILAGRHDASLTATRLMADTRLPLGWAEQRRALLSA